MAAGGHSESPAQLLPVPHCRVSVGTLVEVSRLSLSTLYSSHVTCPSQTKWLKRADSFMNHTGTESSFGRTAHAAASAPLPRDTRLKIGKMSKHMVLLHQRAQLFCSACNFAAHTSIFCTHSEANYRKLYLGFLCKQDISHQKEWQLPLNSCCLSTANQTP